MRFSQFPPGIADATRLVARTAAAAAAVFALFWLAGLIEFTLLGPAR